LIVLKGIRDGISSFKFTDPSTSPSYQLGSTGYTDGWYDLSLSGLQQGFQITPQYTSELNNVQTSVMNMFAPIYGQGAGFTPTAGEQASLFSGKQSIPGQVDSTMTSIAADCVGGGSGGGGGGQCQDVGGDWADAPESQWHGLFDSVTTNFPIGWTSPGALQSLDSAFRAHGGSVQFDSSGNLRPRVFLAVSNPAQSCSRTVDVSGPNGFSWAWIPR
jgi:hypothetical protein